MRVVEVHDVTKRFGDVVAVEQATLDVRQSQIISLLGPSGCGKTTTLRLIAGFETFSIAPIKVVFEHRASPGQHQAIAA